MANLRGQGADTYLIKDGQRKDWKSCEDYVVYGDEGWVIEGLKVHEYSICACT